MVHVFPFPAKKLGKVYSVFWMQTHYSNPTGNIPFQFLGAVNPEKSLPVDKYRFEHTKYMKPFNSPLYVYVYIYKAFITHLPNWWYSMNMIGLFHMLPFLGASRKAIKLSRLTPQPPLPGGVKPSPSHHPFLWVGWLPLVVGSLWYCFTVLPTL